MQTEFKVSSSDSKSVREAASDLGIKIVKTEEIRGFGAEVWTLFSTLASDPFVQGAFFGFLISRKVRIQQMKGGKVIIELENLKQLKEWLKKLS